MRKPTKSLLKLLSIGGLGAALYAASPNSVVQAQQVRTGEQQYAGGLQVCNCVLYEFKCACIGDVLNFL